MGKEHQILLEEVSQRKKKIIKTLTQNIASLLYQLQIYRSYFSNLLPERLLKRLYEKGNDIIIYKHNSQLTFHKIIMVQMQKNIDKLLISAVLIKTKNNNESVGSKRFQVSV